jgi:hypothetical protein
MHALKEMVMSKDAFRAFGGYWEVLFETALGFRV